MNTGPVTAQLRVRWPRLLRARMWFYSVAIVIRLLTQDEAVRRLKRSAARARYEIRRDYVPARHERDRHRPRPESLEWLWMKAAKVLPSEHTRRRGRRAFYGCWRIA